MYCYLKQDAVNVRLPLSSNAAGLKIGVQALDVTGARDETRLALAEVVKLTLGNLSWRRDSARVVILVGDATPIDGADTLSPQQVVSVGRIRPCVHFSLEFRAGRGYNSGNHADNRRRNVRWLLRNEVFADDVVELGATGSGHPTGGGGVAAGDMGGGGREPARQQRAGVRVRSGRAGRGGHAGVVRAGRRVRARIRGAGCCHGGAGTYASDV